jgi:hypothetical protein
MTNLSQSGSLKEVNGKSGFNPISGTQMAPRPIRVSGLGCMIMAQGRSLASALGNTPHSRHSFIHSLYAIKAYAVQNLNRDYRNRNIYNLSESQEATKVLDNYQINSKLVWDRHQSLMQLSKHNRVQLIWVPGHRGTEGNEAADQLEKLESGYPLIGPEPAGSISSGISKKVVMDWTNRDHKKYCESLTGLKQAKGFLQGPSVRRTKELLKLNRNQLQRMAGCCHLKGHLFKMGLINSQPHL